MKLLDPSDPRAPKYWMHETSGSLGAAIRAYLGGGPLTDHQLTLIRLYVEQWVNSPVWDQNPTADKFTRARLDLLRTTAKQIDTRRALGYWLHRALEEGIDPL